MWKAWWVLSILCLSTLGNISAQIEKKSISPYKSSVAPQVDGDLSDSIWVYAPTATNFRMFRPGNGRKAPDRFKTEIKLLYTDEAVYVSAFMYDSHPDSILKQVTVRDVFDEHTDWLVVAFNPFNDGLNDFNFYITAAGVQADSRTTSNGEDFSLNSIWESAVRVHDSGWSCELEIPYISLRFPAKLSKDWGFNAIRSIRRNRHQYSWNFIDRGSGYTAEYQAGVMANMRDINPPVRLSLMPYVSSYVDDFDGNTRFDFNAGMDLKYGLNESFTLDATLIPDFGQVPFDDQFVNLSPFENRFQENRQFFTEGTELFNLGDLFYSRRIGGAPENITGQQLDDTTVVVRTEFTRLVNATKVSGRTNGNLGIGVLNAVTAENFSERDSAGISSRQLLEPLTNYNVLVLDQRINRASSVSFINTNVMREGEYVDANVAGLLASIYTKNGTYRFDGEVKRSDRFYTDSVQSGYQLSARFGDVDGHWRWGVRQELFTDQYDPNDLGFLQRNNLLRNYSEIEYQTFEPSGPFNRYSFTLFSVHASLYKPYRYEEFYLGFNSFFLLRDFTGTGVRLRLRPVESFDFFEPRSPGLFFARPTGGAITWFISTDYRKPFALDVNYYYEHSDGWNRNNHNLRIEPRLRLGEKFFFTPQLIYNYTFNDHGFASKDEETNSPIFGRRDARDLTAVVEGRWAFNPVSSLGLRLRHYWNRIEYQEFFDLLPNNGQLADREQAAVGNVNFNAVNMDLRFSWWFAPASEMVILYRVALSGSPDQVEENYLRNLNEMGQFPFQNNLSIRLSYFLDYNRSRRIFEK